MESSSAEIARMIDASRRALAQWVVNEQFERRPQTSDEYGPDARSAWVADTQVRLAHLSDSIAMGRPELFGEYVAWTGMSFTARKRPVDDMKANLEAMRTVLGEELPSSAATVAGEQIDAAMTRLNGSTDLPPPALRADRPHAALAARYMEALLEGRRSDAAGMIMEAIESGADVRDLYEHVFQPTQAELGRLWHLGELSIADEHMATAATQSIMARAFANAKVEQQGDHSVVVASAAGDLHELGGRMVADFFEMSGWKVRFLGANTPAEALIETLQRDKTDVLAISCSVGGVVRNVAELISAVRASESLAEPLILVGGIPFATVPDLWKQVGADGTASSARDAVRVAEELLAARTEA